MCRGGYSPKIDVALVKKMYQVKLQTGKTLVQQANEAIAAYLAKVGGPGAAQTDERKEVKLHTD